MGTYGKGKLLPKEKFDPAVGEIVRFVKEELVKRALPKKDLMAKLASDKGREELAWDLLPSLRRDPRLKQPLETLVNPGSRSDRCTVSVIKTALVHVGRSMGAISDEPATVQRRSARMIMVGSPAGAVA